MEIWCPYCNAKSEIENELVMESCNDWYEDVPCAECGETFDLFVELEPTALSYVQRKYKCAGCGAPTKHFRLRRNPYATDNKKYCDNCFNKHIEKWLQKFKEEQESAKPIKRGRKRKTE